MKHRIMLAVSILAATSARAQDDKAALARLEGRWRVTAVVAAGKAISDKGMPTSLVVDKGKATFSADGAEIPTFRDLELRPSSDPKGIDLIRDGTSVLPCLYEASDDEFKLAMPMIPADRKPEDNVPRPGSFDSKGKPVVVFTMKRPKG